MMKRISIAGLIGLSVFAAASWAQSFSWRIETPFGELSGSVDPIQLLANPGSYLDPTGVPNTATLLQEAIKNPDRVISLLQNPGDAPYELIASGMVAGRNAVLVKGGNRIPPDVREKLKGWYDDALLDSIRWSTEWNALQSTLQTVQFFGDRKTNAITLLNVVVFREPRMVDNVGLWAHELYHAEQYRDLGVLEFAKRWAKDPSDGGEIEKPAYDRQHQVEQAQTAGTAPLNALAPAAGSCYELTKSTAYCDLWAGNSATAVVFNVQGSAEASGHGGNVGRMRFILAADGIACNSGAPDERPVDTRTLLNTAAYSCEVTVPSGKSMRVLLVAPNRRADAVKTFGTAKILRFDGSR